VIGVEHEGVSGGLTAAWVMRVSLDPPLVAVSIAPERYTHGILRDSGLFTISILGEDQVPDARFFGMNSRRDLDKWAQVDHVRMQDRVPAMAACAGRMFCRVESITPAGDHEIFTASILESEIVAGRPVLPMRGQDYRP
jgi:flavin reductase (DIM6/NTAB) family NADH-FMN oxidoreductase RutF